MSRYGKNIIHEHEFDGKIASVKKWREDSISVNDRTELARELLSAADACMNEKVEVSITLEPAKNDSYLLRLIKTKEQT